GLGTGRGAAGGRRLPRAVAPDGLGRSCSGSALGPGLLGEDGEKVADLSLPRDRVRERKVRLDRVAVAPAVALAGEVARCLELGHDAVRGAPGVSDAPPDLAPWQDGVHVP